MKQLLFILSMTGCVFLSAQTDKNDYYYTIPDYPESYTAGSIAARVVDGLGFRYYWGSEGLTAVDLSYTPSEEARSVEETIDHILILTEIIKNATLEKSFEGIDLDGLTYQQKREKTLQNIREASERLKTSSADDLERYDIVFTSGGEFPFWNLLNGPIADAINHVGQVITFRRTNGNPINQNISVLRGSIRDN